MPGSTFTLVEGVARLVVDPGEGPAGPVPPLFFDQNEALKGRKKLFWRPPPPSEGLALPFSTLGFVTRMQSLIKASPQNKSNASMRVRRRECMPEG